MSQDHASHALRVAPFLWQSLNGRGFRCARADIEQAAVELRVDQFALVETAIKALASGSENPQYTACGAAFRRISSASTRQAFVAASINCRGDVLFELATNPSTGAVFDRQYAALVAPASSAAEYEEAAAVLRRLCGIEKPLHAQLTSPGDTSDPDELPVFSMPPEPADRAPRPPSGPPSTAAGPGVGRATPVRSPRSRAATGGRAPVPDVAPAFADAVPTSTDSRDKPYRQAKVFGSTGALTFEVAPIRQTEGRSGKEMTVMIEGAVANDDTTYNWTNKIAFMCTLRELHQLLAVLMGWTGVLEMGFHGHDRKKSLHIEHQDHGLFVHLRHAKANVRVPVDDADRYALAMLVLHALKANEPYLDTTAILQVCRAVSERPSFKGS